MQTPTEGDPESTAVGYDAATGEVWVDAGGSDLTSLNIDSTSGIFNARPAAGLGGSFDNDSDFNIFKATFGTSFGSFSFGAVAQPGLSQQFLLHDLQVSGSRAGGGLIQGADLIYVAIPEPSAAILLLMALLLMGARTP